jgi:hypothetical protein
MKSSNGETKHRFLEIGRYHRNEEAAHRHLLAVLRKALPNLPTRELKRVAINVGKKATSYDELKREVRETGTASSLWPILGGQDPHFPPQIDIATPSSGFHVELELGGHKTGFQGPMRAGPIELELCEDIISFRREACEQSDDGSFRATTRHYRSYVFACTALIEAFLNRPLLLAVADSKDDDLEQLRRPLDFETRIALWVKVFCEEPIAELKTSTAWDHFQQLRRERNRFIHAAEPHLGFEIRSLAHGFNLVREGVGGFLGKLRSMQRLPKPPFVERLESLPEVTFRPKKGDPLPRKIQRQGHK